MNISSFQPFNNNKKSQNKSFGLLLKPEERVILSTLRENCPKYAKWMEEGIKKNAQYPQLGFDPFGARCYGVIYKAISKGCRILAKTSKDGAKRHYETLALSYSAKARLLHRDSKMYSFMLQKELANASKPAE